MWSNATWSNAMSSNAMSSNTDTVQQPGNAALGLLPRGEEHPPHAGAEHAAPPPIRPRKARRQLPTEVLVVFGSALIAGITMLWNIASSPDTMYDEVSYVTAARNVAQDWQLTWSNSPVFVHPPMSFLAQAAWLRLLGLERAPLQESLVAGRVLAAGVLVFTILLISLVAAYLTHRAGRRRALLLVGVVVVLLATDPILLRYGRMGLIESFALFSSMLTLCAAIWLRNRPPSVYVPIVGLATGLALLTKEMAIFMVATPLVYALLERNRRHALKALGAVSAGSALWAFAFTAWPLQLGLWSEFADVKLLLFKRLLGLVKTTGWNRPGFGFGTFLSEVLAKATDYGTTYLLLATGGLALLWLFFHRGESPYRWLFAWLLTSYAFGSYMVAFGTLNEHLFVYLLPAAVTGTVLVGDAIIARRVASLRARGVTVGRARPVVLLPVLALVALVGFSADSWARSYLPAGDGIVRAAAYVQNNEEPCSVVNAMTSAGAWAPLMPGRVVTDFGSAEAALSHGIHLFYLNEKDAKLGYAHPELPAYVKANGFRVESFASKTYQGIELWSVASDPYDPLADTDLIKDGKFVTTVGSRCGGFAVLDGPAGGFAGGWDELGGKAVAGPPLTGSWSQNGGSIQVFTGAALSASGQIATAMPIVATLASAHADVYNRADLPPVTQPTGSRKPADTLALVVDPAIRTASFGTADNPPAAAVERARARFGDPIGPATQMGDGVLRQAFANGVFERPDPAGPARLAAIGRLAIDTGVLAPPQDATTPDPAPPLVDEQGPAKPTTVRPFVSALCAALALWTVVAALLLGFRLLRTRRAAGPHPWSAR
jgi:4-amino-4-deoxy-L-arabinose transferase-like glycosyltransferase